MTIGIVDNRPTFAFEARLVCRIRWNYDNHKRPPVNAYLDTKSSRRFAYIWIWRSPSTEIVQYTQTIGFRLGLSEIWCDSQPKKRTTLPSRVSLLLDGFLWKGTWQRRAKKLLFSFSLRCSRPPVVLLPALFIYSFSVFCPFVIILRCSDGLIVLSVGWWCSAWDGKTAAQDYLWYWRWYRNDNIKTPR